MKIAVVSDEVYPVNDWVVAWLTEKGYTVTLFGALQTRQETSWVKETQEAAQYLLENPDAEGIFFCWSGTGTCIAANRFSHIRAALCTDSQMVKAARVWNHANVLVLSNRLLTIDLAKEFLSVWFEDYDPIPGRSEVERLRLTNR